MEIYKPKSLNQRFNWSLTPISAPISAPQRTLAISLFILMTGFSNLSHAACEAEKEAAYKYAANSTELQTFRKDFERWADSMRTNSPDWRKTQLEFTKNQVDNSRGFPGQLAYAAAVNCVALAAAATQAQQSPPQSQITQQQSQQGQQQNQSTQQQSQQAQQRAQQAQDSARVAQTRADQARQGQRRRHEPENEASHCIQPDFGGLYGGMKNTCNFKVWYTYCGFRPKENSWLTGMSCEKQSFGSDSVSPGRTSASHTKGVETIHWLACKEPAWALDAEFVPGQGIKGRCYTVGGK